MLLLQKYGRSEGQILRKILVTKIVPCELRKDNPRATWRRRAVYFRLLVKLYRTVYFFQTPNSTEITTYHACLLFTPSTAYNLTIPFSLLLSILKSCILQTTRKMKMEARQEVSTIIIHSYDYYSRHISCLAYKPFLYSANKLALIAWILTWWCGGRTDIGTGGWLEIYSKLAKKK